MKVATVKFCNYVPKLKHFEVNHSKSYAYLVSDALSDKISSYNSTFYNNMFVIKSGNKIYDNPVVIESFSSQESVGETSFQLCTIDAAILFEDNGTPLDFGMTCEFLKAQKATVLTKKDIFASEVKSTINKVEDIIDKGEKNMNMNKNMGINFEFGRINDGKLAISMNGLAFKDELGNYVVYDLETNSLTDVSSFVLDIDMIFAMPVAIKDVRAGDIIKHNKEYVIVESTKDNGDFDCVKPFQGEKITVVPKKNIFGFNYITKVTNLMDNFMSTSEVATPDNPFGNMSQFMLMSTLFNSEKGSGKDNDMIKMMLMSSMMGGNSSNPMLPMFMFMNN